MPRARPTFAIILALTGLSAPAAAQSPTVTAELGYQSRYLWSGIPFSSEGVGQATVSIASGGFTLNGFASYDLDSSDLNEADVYGDYYAQLNDQVGAFVGLGLYNFEFASGWEMTPEFYAGLVLTAPLTPTITVAHDFDLGDGTHVLLSLSESVALGESGASLTLFGDLDYNDGYWVDISGFSFADVGASVSIPVGQLTVTPVALAQFGIDDAFIDEQVFGVRAALTF